MQKRCEDPRCKDDKHIKKCYLHSTNYYYPEIAHQKMYYWACQACVTADHRAWEKDNKERLKKLAGYKSSKYAKGGGQHV